MDDIKHISFERTGGFANIRFATDFELGDLPEDQAHQLRDLLDDLDFDELPAILNNTGNADGFTYVITVDSKKGAHTVTVSDASAPEKMHPLFDLLVKIARQRMKK